MSDVDSLPYGQGVDSLRYNQVSFKAAHNSNDRDETLTQQLGWDAAQPWQAGCRGLELDVSQSESGNRWSVGHDDGYSSSAPALSQYLGELREWAERTPGHDVVTLYLDLKKVQPGGAFAGGLEEYLSAYLIRPLYQPADLMGDQASVRDGALVHGWPTLGELRGKFIIVLSGDDEAKQLYAADDPRNRLCFSDKSCEPDEVPQSSTRVFFNYHLYQDDKSKWCPVFQGQVANPASVVRGYVINDGGFWTNALSCGCNLLTTDRIRNYSWATVSSSAPFAQLGVFG